MDFINDVLNDAYYPILNADGASVYNFYGQVGYDFFRKTQIENLGFVDNNNKLDKSMVRKIPGSGIKDSYSFTTGPLIKDVQEAIDSNTSIPTNTTSVTIYPNFPFRFNGSPSEDLDRCIILRPHMHNTGKYIFRWLVFEMKEFIISHWNKSTNSWNAWTTYFTDAEINYYDIQFSGYEDAGFIDWSTGEHEYIDHQGFARKWLNGIRDYITYGYINTNLDWRRVHADADTNYEFISNTTVRTSYDEDTGEPTVRVGYTSSKWKRLEGKWAEPKIFLEKVSNKSLKVLNKIALGGWTASTLRSPWSKGFPPADIPQSWIDEIYPPWEEGSIYDNDDVFYNNDGGDPIEATVEYKVVNTEAGTNSDLSQGEDKWFNKPIYTVRFPFYEHDTHSLVEIDTSNLGTEGSLYIYSYLCFKDFGEFAGWK